jgi:hypothetical protein
MPDTAQINIRVSEAQKEEWEEYVGESGQYKTLTGLIRGAVHTEIHDDPEKEHGVPPALQNDIQGLREDIEEIKSDVDWIRRREQSDAGIEDLAQEVYSSLVTIEPVQGSLDVPEGDDEEEARYRIAAQDEIEPHSENEATEDGRILHTKQAIADRVGSDPDDVEDAIDYLQERLMPVIAVEYDNQTHYFRED